MEEMKKISEIKSISITEGTIFRFFFRNLEIFVALIIFFLLSIVSLLNLISDSAQASLPQQNPRNYPLQ